eukprot:scaffold4924_cov84-Skeletonema_dohrnii-CCMP3373.AAC.1
MPQMNHHLQLAFLSYLLSAVKSSRQTRPHKRLIRSVPLCTLHQRNYQLSLISLCLKLCKLYLFEQASPSMVGMQLGTTYIHPLVHWSVLDMALSGVFETLATLLLEDQDEM